MAKKEKTADERLKDLYQLQLIDSRLDEIQVLKGELPAEVQDLEDSIAGLEKRIKNFEDSIEEQENEISKHNANIKEAENLILKYTKQLDEVKNNREFDALSKELELQKLEIELSEKRKKEASVQIESKKELLENTQQKLNQRKEDLKIKRDELDKIIAKTEKDEKKLLKESEKQRKKIEARYLKAYDRIRTTYRNGLAVVTVERESCGGCFNRIPPQQQLEISIMNKVMICEHCGRIFVDNQTAEELSAAMA